MKRDKEERLSEYVNNQSGYFSAQQAHGAGYSYRLHSYYVKTGKWVKAGRGVFRLRSFPPSEREDLVQWTLWSRDRKGYPQAVASNETALAIHELSDVMPAKFHFTVPPAFRKKAPKGCVLYFAKLEENDKEPRQGYSVTTPIRTLVDVAEGDLSEDELAKALCDALDKGLVQLKKIDVMRMTGRGKLRMLMAIKAVKERKTA